MPRILIVEDGKTNRNALVRWLGDKRPDWTIFSAANEDEAKALIQKELANGTPIDVVVTDLAMRSQQSGMNLLLESKRLDPSIMAILFTGKEKILDRYKAFEYGAFDVIEKTIRGAEAAHEILIKTQAA